MLKTRPLLEEDVEGGRGGGGHRRKERVGLTSQG